MDDEDQIINGCGVSIDGAHCADRMCDRTLMIRKIDDDDETDRP